MHERLERAVEAAHERDVVIGDLHPSNVLVTPDDRVVLIDLEVASLLGEGRRPTLGDPAFIAPQDRHGFDVDRYALAALRLFLFMPLTALIGHDAGKAEGMANAIAEVFPVSREFLQGAVDTIIGRPAANGPRPSARAGRPALEPTPEGWRLARDSIARAISMSATPGRDDRLFPGDPEQFETGGLNLAHGAAGVLYALAATGAHRDPGHEQWLVDRATTPGRGTRLGFYDGLHGVAHVLDFLGRREDALNVMEICSQELEGRWDRLGQDLGSGLAGVGLNLVDFADRTGDSSFWQSALAVADIVADRLGGEEDVEEISGGRYPHAGLLRGSSGPALFFLRLFERTGNDVLLDLAATALGQDLRRCIPAEDDALEVNEGWRTMPYLVDGSVGIGIVLERFLAHRHDERFAAAAAAIHRAAEAQFYIEPGLFFGRAGMILFLAGKHPPGSAAADPIIAAQVRRLEWHALSYKGELAFPGEQLLRLSKDLATGSSGIALAMGAALHDAPVHLPFLDPNFENSVAPARDRVLLEGRG
jgi:hypothetical protein